MPSVWAAIAPLSAGGWADGHHSASIVDADGCVDIGRGQNEQFGQECPPRVKADSPFRFGGLAYGIDPVAAGVSQTAVHFRPLWKTGRGRAKASE